MAQFKKRFHGRNHVPGQLITAAELVEMQQLQYKTYCNIEADRYGLNPNGSFTPHVISGLKPSVVSGAHQIKIGRGHGWISGAILTPYDKERFAVVLEDDLFVDLPAPNATHPYWCQVYLESLSAGRDLPYGNAVVAFKGKDDVIRNVSTPLYYKTVTTTAATVGGTPAASPKCPVMSSTYQLPIATVLINPGDTGAIPADQLYDVRWFAPGHGSFWIHDAFATAGISMNCGRTWNSIYWDRVTLHAGSYDFQIRVRVPNRSVFALIPECSVSALASYESHVSADSIFAPAKIVQVAGSPSEFASPLTGYDVGWIALDLSGPQWNDNDKFNVVVNFANKY